MRSLRGSVWLIVAAALLPLLMFVIFQIGYSAREQRRTIESRALAKSESVILAADARVGRITTGVDALATARSIRDRNWVEFKSRASEIAALTNDWQGVQLIDPTTGSTLISNGAVPSRIVHSVQPSPKSDSAFTGFAWGKGCPCLIFERLTPVVNGKRLLLRVLVRPDPFFTMLPTKASEYPVSAIVGPAGTFVSRTVDMRHRFGTPGSPSLQAAIGSGRKQGIYRGVTLEGFENYTAFTRSSLTGWSAHLALGSKYIDNPARRFFASLGVTALLSVLLATLLILFALRQLTEARRVSEHMQQAQKLEALGQLTGGIAHDFNNLLTPIIGSLEWVAARPELDDRTRRLANGGLASAHRASKLTRQLLAFSRRQKLMMEPVDLSALLAEIRPMLLQSAGPDVELEILLGAEHCWVETDPTQFELALINLVLNARDASPSDGRIEVRLEWSGDSGREHCVVSVSDEGAGMPEEVKRRAFEPFFTTKEQGKGTGLGLAQVYALTQQSNGSVTIDSPEGKGTRVSLIFPCYTRPVHAGADPAQTNHSIPAAHILVVEDEADVRASIVAALEQDGHRIDDAEGGESALKLLAKGNYDLLVTDFTMPGISGAELIAQARAQLPELRTLIITGYLDSEAVERAALGTPVIVKPFDSAKLRRFVRRMMTS